MKKYIESLKNALPSIKEEELTMPVSGTSLDSIDLVLLRVTLEKLTGKEIPNIEWQGFNTIQDAIRFCINHQSPDGAIDRNTKSIVTDRKYSIGMPQMANSALSENWLFKELGDIHWELLSKGLNTQSANFTDESGKRLYAAFTRIHIANCKLNEFKENENIEFNGIIKRFGLSTYVSKVIFGNGRQKSQAVLMTSFSTRDALDNSRLFKSQPYTKENYVPEFEYTPQILNDYRLQRKGLLETFKIHHEEISLSTSYVHKTNYTINPFYEINGVGLLYFASYPIISDKCEADYFNQTIKYREWERKYYTVERDVFYFSNCNIDDSISYRLNSYEFIREGKVMLFSSLYRVSDMTLMANIFTIKQIRTL